MSEKGMTRGLESGNDTETQRRHHIDGFIRQLMEYYFGFSNEVPRQRITADMPNYPNYMAQDAFFQSVKNTLEKIIASGILPDSSEVKSEVNKIIQMTHAKRSLATEGAGKTKIPSELKQAIIDKINEGMSPSDALNALLNEEVNPEKRAEIIQQIFSGGIASRMPTAGDVPEDLWKQRKGQVTEIQEIIANTINLLQKNK